MKSKAIVLIMLVLALNSIEAAVIDQYQEQYDTSWLVICPDWLIAQTFTAGISGQLEKIDLYLDNISSSDLYPTTISIVNVIGEVPSGSVFGQVYADNLIEGFNSINFLSESVFLSAGSQYGIVLSNDDSERYTGVSTQWRSTTEDVYSGGSVWVYLSGEGWVQSVQPPDESMPLETFYDKDAAFITYMVPEPTTALLFCLGSIIILKSKRL